MNDRIYSMGRLYHRDERDDDYPVSTLLASMPRSTETKRFWFSDGWWGDQGHTPHCVAYSWAHFIHDGPKVGTIYRDKSPIVDTRTLYCEAKKRDPWPGDCDTPLYDGTSVRAGAKVLKDWGHIAEYRWAKSAAEVISTLLVQGPVIAGTWWRYDMFFPNSEGIIKITGHNVGGHAYVINGVNLETGFFRIKNSWGTRWGRGGHALISIEDMDSLIKNFGEVCVPLQKRFEG